MLFEPSLELLVAAEGVAQELLDDVVLTAAVEELAVGSISTTLGSMRAVKSAFLRGLSSGSITGVGCPPRWNVMTLAIRERCASR